MKERIANLLTVKSIVTIITICVFAFLAVTGKVSSTEFLTILTMIVSFYFGTQSEKKNERGGNDNDGTRIA